MRLRIVGIFLFIFALAQGPSFAADQPISKGMFGAGVNYPGVGVRYLLADSTALELKGQAEKHVQVAGLRAYQYFFPALKVMPFLGVEASYIGFADTISKGTGLGGELFAGAEYFPVERLSLQVDVGPSYINLRDKGNAQTKNGLDFVLNFGLNYYFGAKRR